MEYIKTKEYTVRDLKEEELCEIKEYMKEDMIKSYPSFNEWFDRVKLESNGRRFVGVVDNQTGRMLGLMVLKLTENKICTLFIKEGYRRKGFGNLLLMLSFEILKTRKPRITISEKHIRDFSTLLNKHNFLVTDMKKGLYIKGVCEFIFN